LAPKTRDRTAAAKTRFDGFDPALQRFFVELGAHNEKAWFEAHRADYERLYAEPAKAFVAAIGPGLAKLAPGVEAVPKIGGAIHRIHRDTRFAKDKTPYKTALIMRFAAGKTSPAYMLRITPTALGIAVGMFGFEPDQLARYRDAVAEPKTAKALRAAIAKGEKAGYALGEPHLKRVPRGFDPDDPAGDLLRYKGLHLGGDRPAPPELFGPEATAWCIARFRELKPVHDWLTSNVD
jgi:uncharacterized protein (TIGR02453 family)